MNLGGCASNPTYKRIDLILVLNIFTTSVCTNSSLARSRVKLCPGKIVALRVSGAAHKRFAGVLAVFYGTLHQLAGPTLRAGIADLCRRITVLHACCGAFFELPRLSTIVRQCVFAIRIAGTAPEPPVLAFASSQWL